MIHILSILLALSTPCPTEDAAETHSADAPVNCYWDATSRGNNRGRSFLVVDGATFYVSNNTTQTSSTVQYPATPAPAPTPDTTHGPSDVGPSIPAPYIEQTEVQPITYNIEKSN